MRGAPPIYGSAIRNPSPALQALLRQARENGLESIDFQTISDLCELSERCDEELIALLTGMLLSLREGSVCLEVSRESILRRFDGLMENGAAEILADAITAKFKTDGFPQAIGRDAAEHKPVIRQTHGERTLVYFQKYLKHERALQQLLVARLTNANAPHANASAIVREILSGPGRPPSDFSDEQKIAIALSLLRNFVVVSGGPGTGKTSVVFGVLRALLRGGVSATRIALACPTGRAAQRLTESIRAGVLKLGKHAGADSVLSAMSAKTLHRLLGYSPSSGRFMHHRENPLPYDVIVVDELSMVDIVMMSRLLDAVPPDAKLLLIGDKNQLPSVDAGSVLSDLMPRDGRAHFSAEMAKRLAGLTELARIDAEISADALRDTVVVLQKNFRSQPHIREVSSAINALPVDDAKSGAEALVTALPRVKLERSDNGLAWPGGEYFVDPQKNAGGCWFLEAGSTDAWQDAALAWAKHHYVDSGYLVLAAETAAPVGASASENLSKVFEVLHRARILTLVREGPCGSTGANRTLAQMLWPGEGLRRGTLFTGAPVLVTSNDYALDVFNGDVGVALAAENERGMQVVFERQDALGMRRYLSIPVEALPAHELAFAMTVHKSQGSEYGEVLLTLPGEGAQRLLNRQLIYTAITRAKHLAVICGPAGVLRSALCRSLERTSGLDLS